MESRMPRLFLPLAAIACGLIGLAFAVYLALPGGRGGGGIGGPFSLIAQDGRRVSDADFRGAPMLVFFGYSHCPDVCPATLSDLSLALAKLPKDFKVAAIFVTVDPERDTPAALKEYLSSFDPRILGLSGARAELEPMYKAYRVYSKRVAGLGAEYAMDHTALVYRMDSAGNFVGSLNLSQPPQDAAREIAALR